MKIFQLLKSTPAVRWGITLLVFIILVIQLQNELLHSDFQFSATLNYPFLVLAVALLPFNYFLETYKWRLLINPFYPNITFLTCLKAVLVGTGLGLFTPNRVGEYVGRLGALSPKHRYEAATATLINRLTQLIATLFFGFLGLLYTAYFVYFNASAQNIYNYDLNIRLTALASLILLIVLIFFAVILTRKYNFSWINLIRLIKKKRYLHLFLRYLPFIIRIIRGGLRIRRKVILTSILLALIRYSIFSTQYVLLLMAFGVTLFPALCYALVAVIFLLKSFIPSMALAELGIREALAIYVFSFVNVPFLPVVQATFALYIVNLFMPALVGTIIMPQWMKNGSF